MIKILILILISIISINCLKKEQLKLNPSGKFKILQFTDLHYGEADWKDELSARAQRIILENEMDTDLVVLTGDSVSGYAWNKSKGWLADKWTTMVQPMVNANVNWAMALGNHDDQADLNRSQIVTFDSSFNNSYTQQGPYSIKGATNYFLPVYDESGENMVFILYFFDSNDNNCEGVEGWGCVYPDQVEWYRQTSTMLTQKNGGIVLPALAFMHIPVPEYMDMWNTFTVNGSLEDTGVCCFSVNTGLFSTFLEMGDIKYVLCGHDHNNDFIGSIDNITLGYGRKSGYGAYGPPIGWLHGARILEITLPQNPSFETISISTYLRLEDGTAEYTPISHSPNPSQSWNACCDTAGFPTISNCKKYEENFLSLYNLK